MKTKPLAKIAAILALNAIAKVGEAVTPKKKTVWIAGKSLKECMGAKRVINEETFKCRNGYFEEMP